MSNIIHKSPGKQTMTAWAKKWREERRARERHREMLKHGQGRSDVEEINRMIEQAPKHKPERILVGDRGHWIERHGEPAGDGRQKYSIWSPEVNEELRELGASRFSEEYGLEFIDPNSAPTEIIANAFTNSVRPLWK